MAETVDVVVIGAGQAGLATSHELSARGVGHVVLEAERPGFSWTRRWDSFTLVTPNHAIRLPGATYAGKDPHGYLPRAEVEDLVVRYAAGLTAEVRSGVRVERLSREGGGYALDTDHGPMHSRIVVVATGAYQRQLRPPGIEDLPPGTAIVESVEYRNPQSLPPGAVLVVGGGQSACQISEELVLSGRDVVLACGRAPWFYRRVEGRDLFDLLLDAGFLEAGPDDLPTPLARLGANIQATGARGGHDLSYRTLAALGVRLGGHLGGCDARTVYLSNDLPGTIAFGDQAFGMLRDEIQQWRHTLGAPALDIPVPGPFEPEPVTAVPLSEVGSVVLATGFRSRYTEWIGIPDIVDELGFPVHDDGESRVAPGVHFVGVHLLRTRASALLLGVGADAARTADRVAAAAA